MDRLLELKFVWLRLKCAITAHKFKVNRDNIVYCERCNWFGGCGGARNSGPESEY